MGGIGGIIRGALAGANEAAGNTGTEQALLAANQRAIDLKNEQRQTQLGLLLNEWNNTTDPSQREQIMTAMHSLYPQEHAHHFLRDMLHLRGKQHPQVAPQPSPATPQNQLGDQIPAITNPGAVLQGAPIQTANPQLSQVQSVAQAPTAADAWKAITQIPSPAQTNLNLAKAHAQALIDEIKLRNAGNLDVAHERAMNSPTRVKLDAAARKLGYDDYASMPLEKQGEAWTESATISRAPTWKAVRRGNQIYAVDAHNASDPGKPIGYVDDMTSRLEWRTASKPDGSQYLVPVTVWSKKGSSAPIMETQGEEAADAGGNPVSAKTPQVPGTPSVGATNQDAVNNKLNRKKSQSRQLPTSTSTEGAGPDGMPKGAIAIGGKQSPEAKLLGQQWNKASEDATSKKKDYESVQALLKDPNRVTDLHLVFAWVRSNVQGAGRMTNTEIQQAAKAGSLGTRAKNAIEQATTGRLAPEIETQFASEIQHAYEISQKAADDLKIQFDNAMHKAPVSNKTPGGPGAWKPPADAPPAPKEDGKVLKANGQIIAKSQGGNWVQP
jgi:hypothetical protein